MKKLLLAALLALLPLHAYALDDASTPPKFPLPWGNSAGGSFIRNIPTSSQIGIQNGAASLTDGFPPLTFQPIGSGGIPPFGQDMNGILKQLSQGVRWGQAGGPYNWDSSFNTSIGGYPKGAVVMSTIVLGDYWMSQVDNNTTNPDAGGANWVFDPGRAAPGDMKTSFSSTAPFGWVIANATTIGNASSNATQRANADTQFLFAYVWANCSSLACPLLNSSGIAVSRGVSAAADYSANNAITLFDQRGTSTTGVDTMSGGTTTRLSGVPVTLGSSTIVGSTLGENLHALIVSELASHFHSAGISDPGHTHNVGGSGQSPIYGTSGGGGIGGGGGFGLTGTFTIVPSATGVRVNSANGLDTTASAGGNASHNTVERSNIVYYLLKL